MSPNPLVQLSQLDGLERFQHEAMATTFTFHLGPVPGVDLRGVAEEAFRLVDKIEDLLSFYREGSDVTRINRAHPGEVVRLNDITHQCLLTALEISAASDNAFNPFAGALALAAKKQSTPSHLIDRPKPTPSDATPVLEIDPTSPRVTKLTGTRWLDLGAIGKGVALDAAAELLCEWEITTAVLVSGGSSVVVFGRPLTAEKDAWPLILPIDPLPVQLQLPTPFALGASGQGFQPGHVIGPVGGRKPRPQSVVIAPSAAVADALSTAALLLDDQALRDLMGNDPAFSALATHAERPAVQTGLFAPLALSQIEATLVIPCWCESHRLPAFLQELTSAIARAKLLVEIIVVDDGSPEPEPTATAAAIDRLRPTHPFLRPLLPAAHQGKGGAIYSGWRTASASSRWLAFVDADGAVPADEVVRGLRLALKAPDQNVLVAATRYHRDRNRVVKRGFIRQRTGGWFAGWARRQLDLGAIDSQCGFKVVPATWWRDHRSWQELGYAFDLELLLVARDAQIAVENLPIAWQEIGGSSVTWRDGLKLIKTVRRLRKSHPRS